MVKLSIVICLALMLIGGAGAVAVSAATPTHTPTLRPIQATATSITLYLRPNPTLWNVATPVEAFPLDVVSGNLGVGADYAIQVYHTVNKDHQIDMIAGEIVAFSVVTMAIGFFLYKMKTR